MATNIGISITPEEETLIKVVSIPQGPIEWTWLSNTVSIISGKSSNNIIIYNFFNVIIVISNLYYIYVIYVHLCI
jgi:hypothetical protein